ncbi:GIY-YIG nuclease family protein [Streptococcus gallolyticus]|uniref:GIY-YIG nuclease family protein n=1 Tax=Streptococcus hepaticus TaxID=3349163 RepID=UPI001C94D118|nr:GIY-YIG nuclease family protein [Streptococcus gallolyticus]MBY5040488.1 GIY-YIG nuclease family protein [Streptococcus gallolyticus]
MENKAYMYVVECADGSLYTGYTTDIARRIQTHNRGKGAKYTKTRLPVTLLYWEEFDSKNAAMSAEALFKKKTRQAKLEYIREQLNRFSS